MLKADLGIKDGRVAGVGRAGNPDITDGIDLTIGPGTWPIPCHGLIATPGGVDSHVHLLSPRLVPVALSAGITTLITAGFEEPVSRMHRTLDAFEQLPVNVGLQASARADRRPPLDALIEGGSVGLKIHEDWGAYPEIVDATLEAAQDHDIAVCLHTDGLNESTELEGTVAAIGGRTIHAYHVEGTGGGHIPDLLRPGPRGQRALLVHHAQPAVGPGLGRRSARHDHDRARAEPGRSRRRGSRARTDPRHVHGGRRSAARAGRDLDRELRLPGHGPDRRDDPADVAARPTR